jgi:N utilization substance protein B
MFKFDKSKSYIMNKENTIRSRTVTRLIVVQSLYQMDIAGTDKKIIIDSFSDRVVLDDIKNNLLKSADKVFFNDLIEGVVRTQQKIDPEIDSNLPEDWKLSRIDITLRAIFRAATFELMYRLDVPFKVIINEYIEITNSFYDQKEPDLVNGVLDSIANKFKRVI